MKGLPRRRDSGYTLLELMVSTAVGTIVLGGAVCLWVFASRTWYAESIKTDLQRKLEIAIENIKKDLRATSSDRIFYYPADQTDFEAISFPLALDSDGDGVVEVDADGRLIWDETVVYHALRTDPTQLRRTVFGARDNTLTDAQRYEQLAYVAANGHGAGTYEGPSARTKTLFSNLFDVSIQPKAAAHDTYAPARCVQRNTSLGSVALASGEHTIALKVRGKNSASSGYRIALDAISFGRSGYRIEAEDLLAVATVLGGTVSVEDMSSAGGWSGNKHLVFDASGPGSMLTLAVHNDCWIESLFQGEGAAGDNTRVVFQPSPSPGRFVVELEGNGEAWSAASQAASPPQGTDESDLFADSAVRIVVEGGDPLSGGHVLLPGARCRIWFRAHPTAGRLYIDNVWIARRGSGPDAASGTTTPVTFQHVSSSAGCVSRNGGLGVDIAPGNTAPSDWIDFAVSPDGDYVVSFAVAVEAGKDRMTEWRSPGRVGSYVLPGESAMAGNAVWSANAGLDPRESVLAVERIDVTYPSEGRFASRIFDSHEVNTRVRTLRWEEVLNGGILEMRLRAGNQPDLSDAPGWDSAASFAGGSSSHTVPSSVTGRYLQFMAVLAPSADTTATPRLEKVELAWDPEVAVCDLVTDITGDPAGGIFEVFVDGRTPTRAVTVNLALFNEFLGVRYEEEASAEVEPRNTGR